VCPVVYKVVVDNGSLAEIPVVIFRASPVVVVIGVVQVGRLNEYPP
jgi:hypothetical protein